MSAHCFPCLRIVSHVCTLLPASARLCPCPHIVAHVRMSLPVSTCRCPCLRIFACVHMLLPTSVYVHGWLFLFMGVGGSLCWWAVIFVHGQRQCGGGEPLVGGGESSGLAFTFGSMAVVVPGSACHGCHVIVWLPCRQPVLYTPPQIPYGLHMDSMNPSGVHSDSTWTPDGIQVDSTWSSLILSCLVASAHIFDTLYKTHVTS